MTRRSVFIIVALLLGCAHRGSPPPSPTASRTTTTTTTTIAVAQPWPQARAVALSAGYELGDASQIAMVPAPDGFYIDMPGRRGLLVFRDPRRNVVKRTEWVENWPGPKAPRVYHDVQSFNIPPAARADRAAR
jgi:hypothetical protein